MEILKARSEWPDELNRKEGSVAPAPVKALSSTAKYWVTMQVAGCGALGHCDTMERAQALRS